MDLSSRRKEESRYDVFGVTAESASLAIKETLENVAESVIDSLSKKLKHAAKDDVKSNLISAFMTTLKNMDGFIEDVVKELLNVPSPLILPENEVQRTQYTKQDEVALETRIKEMMAQLIAMDKLEMKLVNQSNKLKNSEGAFQELQRYQEILKTIEVSHKNKKEVFESLSPTENF